MSSESIAIIVCTLVTLSSVLLALHFIQIGANALALALMFPAFSGIIGIGILFMVFKDKPEKEAV